MQKLEKLLRIKLSNDINRLRKMYDQIEVCVRNLKALNIDISTCWVILVPFWNGKLPSEIRVILSRNFQNDIWQLNDMLKMQTSIYENGLQIVLSWKNSLIQIKIIVDLKLISAIVKDLWKTYMAVAAIKLGYRFWGLYIWFWEHCPTAEKLDVTKGKILRVGAVFFDPLGLISPITLQPKLIFQKLCRNKLRFLRCPPSV